MKHLRMPGPGLGSVEVRSENSIDTRRERTSRKKALALQFLEKYLGAFTNYYTQALPLGVIDGAGAQASVCV